MPWERSPNMLLTKSELGRAKPTVRDLPPEGFVYGNSVNYGLTSKDGIWLHRHSYVQVEISRSNIPTIQN
jgi:hypothetical protein